MLKTILIILAVGVFLIGILATSAISSQYADAGSTRKLHFTQTVTSGQDPGIGHESHQLAMILSPNPGTIYDGSMTYTSSKPVQIVILHEINPDDARGQMTWSIDGKNIYGLSLIDSHKSGTVEFTGAALALHYPEPEEFTVTASVDGWIRGQPSDVIVQKIEVEKSEPSILLSRLNVPVTIPTHKGLYNEQLVSYIITDSSDHDYAKKLSDLQDWKIKTASSLANVKPSQKIFVFTNGIGGDGLYGSQEEIFTTIPSKSDYNPLSSVVEVSWKKGQNAIRLDSADKVIEAHKGSRVDFHETGFVVNVPQIVWPDGQMKVRDNQVISDDLSFEGGQITAIDNKTMNVTFVAHRGWGPDGTTTYCIVAGATPLISAEMMGVVHSPNLSALNDSSIMDVYHFQNGIKGTGPLGFQPGITSGLPGNENYSPIMRTHLVEWNSPESAKILESKSDVDYFVKNNEITVSLARLANSEYVVNCPVVDPFQ